MQHSNKGQIAVAFGKIQSIAYHEKVRNGKTDIICSHFLDPPRGLFQQHTGFDLARFQLPQLSQHPTQCSSCIQDVIHQQHIAATHVKSQLLGKHQLARLGPQAITGNAHKIQPQRQRQTTNHMRQKENRSVQDSHDHQFTSDKVPLDFLGETFDAPVNLPLGDEHLLQVATPMQKRRIRTLSFSGNTTRHSCVNRNRCGRSAEENFSRTSGARASVRFSRQRSRSPIFCRARFFPVQCPSALQKKIAPPRSFRNRSGLKPALRLHSYRSTVRWDTSRQTPSLELRAKMWPSLMAGLDQHLPSTA